MASRSDRMALLQDDDRVGEYGVRPTPWTVHTRESRFLTRVVTVAAISNLVALSVAAWASSIAASNSWTGQPTPNFVSRLADPLLFQLIATVHAVICVRSALDGWRVRAANGIRDYLTAGAIVLLPLSTYYVVNTAFLTTLFGASVSYGPDTGFLMRWLHLPRAENPSGFAGRGAMLLLLVSLATPVEGRRRVHPLLTSPWTAFSIQILLLLLTCGSRVVFAGLDLTAILLGLAVGSCGFWLAVLPLGLLIKRIPIGYAYRLGLVTTCASIVLLLIGFFHTPLGRIAWVAACFPVCAAGVAQLAIRRQARLDTASTELAK